MDIEFKKQIFYWGCAGLLLGLAFVIALYRRALYGQYQLGAHLMALGMLIAIAGAFIAAYFESIAFGARLGLTGFLLGIFGAYKQTSHLRK